MNGQYSYHAEALSYIWWFISNDPFVAFVIQASWGWEELEHYYYYSVHD